MWECSRALQKDLNALADAGTIKLTPRLETDGLFGEKTEAAVKKAQTALKVDVDGIVGNQTFGVLARKLSEPLTMGRKVAPAHQKKVIKLLLKIAQKEVGTREVGGAIGVRIRDYQRVTDDRPLGPWPWCAAFASWCIREWVAQPAVRAALGWKTEEEAEERRPKTSRAFSYIDWAREQNQLVLPETAKPEPGMIVVYDFSHIGIVKKAVGRDSFIAIEGNTMVAETVIARPAMAFGKRNGLGTWCEISFSGGSLPNQQRQRLLPRSPCRREFLLRSAVSARFRENRWNSLSMRREWTAYRFPGGQSGVTIGHGYDLGAETAAELYHDWESVEQGATGPIKEAVGKSGPQAVQMCRQFEDIKISTEAADDVFYRYTRSEILSADPGDFSEYGCFPRSRAGSVVKPGLQPRHFLGRRAVGKKCGRFATFSRAMRRRARSLRKSRRNFAR